MNATKQAMDLMISALQAIGIAEAKMVKERAIRVATFGNRGWINIDLAKLHGTVLKITLYSNAFGAKYVKELRGKTKEMYGVVVERGNFYDPANAERDEGVVFKLNTGVDWIIATQEDFERVALMAKDLKSRLATVWG